MSEDLTLKEAMLMGVGKSVMVEDVIELLERQAAGIAVDVIKSMSKHPGFTPAMSSPIMFGSTVRGHDGEPVPMTFIGMCIDSQMLAEAINLESIVEEINERVKDSARIDIQTQGLM